MKKWQAVAAIAGGLAPFGYVAFHYGDPSNARQGPDGFLAYAAGFGLISIGLLALRKPPAEGSIRSNKAPIVAIAASFVLAFGALYLRNQSSLEAAFSRIDSPQDIVDWIAQGGDPERGAQKQMEVDLEYAANMPGGLWRQREVLAKYPNAPAAMKAPVEAAIKARYEYLRTQAHAIAKQPDLVKLVDQFYDRIETGGAPMLLFSLPNTDTTALAKLDEMIPPAQRDRIVAVGNYFGSGNALTRRDQLQAAVQSGLERLFPSEVLATEPAAGQTLLEVQIFSTVRPSISPERIPVLYSEVDSDGKPVPGSKLYPGVEYELGAKLHLSGSPPMSVHFTATPAPEISVTTSRAHASPDPSAVYSAMSRSAFDDLQTKLVVALGGAADVTTASPPTAPARTRPRRPRTRARR
jgi:hypothetical protein